MGPGDGDVTRPVITIKGSLATGLEGEIEALEFSAVDDGVGETVLNKALVEPEQLCCGMFGKVERTGLVENADGTLLTYNSAGRVYLTVGIVANRHVQNHRVLLILLYLFKQEFDHNPVASTYAYLHRPADTRLRLGVQEPRILQDSHIEGCGGSRKIQLFGNLIDTETTYIQQLKDVDPCLICKSPCNTKHFFLVRKIKKNFL